MTGPGASTISASVIPNNVRNLVRGAGQDSSSLRLRSGQVPRNDRAKRAPSPQTCHSEQREESGPWRRARFLAALGMTGPSALLCPKPVIPNSVRNLIPWRRARFLAALGMTGPGASTFSASVIPNSVRNLICVYACNTGILFHTTLDIILSQLPDLYFFLTKF